MSTSATPRDPQGTQVFVGSERPEVVEYDGANSVVVHDDIPSGGGSPLWKQMDDESAFSSTGNGLHRRMFRLSDVSTNDDPIIVTSQQQQGSPQTPQHIDPQTNGTLASRRTTSKLTITTEPPAAATGRQSSSVLSSPNVTLASQATGNSSCASDAFRKMADAMMAEVEEELEGVTAQRDQLARELEWYKAQHTARSTQIDQLTSENARLKHELMSLRLGGVAGPVPAAPPAWWASAKADLLRELLVHGATPPPPSASTASPRASSPTLPPE